VLRRFALTGDIAKVKPGDTVRIITVSGEQIALGSDVALEPSDAGSAVEESLPFLIKFCQPTQPWSGVCRRSCGLRGLEPGLSTYASATSVTLTGNQVSSFPKGTKVRIKQSETTKYFYAVGAVYGTDTTLTLAAGRTTAWPTPRLTNSPSRTWRRPTASRSGSTTPNLDDHRNRAFAGQRELIRGQFRVSGQGGGGGGLVQAASNTTFGSGTFQFALPVAVFDDGVHGRTTAPAAAATPRRSTIIRW